MLHGSSACESDTACPVAEDLDEMNIEIMRNTLYKAYLDDFAKFCNKLGGSTAAVMGDLLSFEVCMPFIVTMPAESAPATLNDYPECAETLLETMSPAETMARMLYIMYDSHLAYLVYYMHSGPAGVVLWSNAE